MIGVEVSPRSAERFAHCTMISVCLARSHLDFSPNAKRMAPSHESACINRLPSVYQSSVQQKLPLRFGSQGRFQSSSSTPGLGHSITERHPRVWFLFARLPPRARNLDLHCGSPQADIPCTLSLAATSWAMILRRSSFCFSNCVLTTSETILPIAVTMRCSLSATAASTIDRLSAASRDRKPSSAVGGEDGRCEAARTLSRPARHDVCPPPAVVAADVSGLCVGCTGGRG